MAVLIQLFAAFWGAFFDALLTHLPQIMAAMKTAGTTTMTDSPAPPASLTAAIDKEITDATK